MTPERWAQVNDVPQRAMQLQQCRTGNSGGAPPHFLKTQHTWFYPHSKTTADEDL
jgi:hypothetical protein